MQFRTGKFWGPMHGEPIKQILWPHASAVLMKDRVACNSREGVLQVSCSEEGTFCGLMNEKAIKKAINVHNNPLPLSSHVSIRENLGCYFITYECKIFLIGNVDHMATFHI